MSSTTTTTRIREYRWGPNEREETTVDDRYGVHAEIVTSTWIRDDGSDGRSTTYVHVDGCANTEVDHTHPLTGGRLAGFMTTPERYHRDRGRCSDCAAGREPWSAASWNVGLRRRRWREGDERRRRQRRRSR